MTHCPRHPEVRAVFGEPPQVGFSRLAHSYFRSRASPRSVGDGPAIAAGEASGNGGGRRPSGREDAHLRVTVMDWCRWYNTGRARRGAERRLGMTLFVRGLLSAVALIVASPKPATAQPADYPSRPVTFIVPFAPGGVTSLFARILGAKLEQRLGKPFVVENRPG